MGGIGVVSSLCPALSGLPGQREGIFGPRPLAWALLGRPVGARNTHPRCPAKDMGQGQPLGREWTEAAPLPAAKGRVRGHFLALLYHHPLFS
jgi:hypothetical protein